MLCRMLLIWKFINFWFLVKNILREKRKKKSLNKKLYVYGYDMVFCLGDKGVEIF